MDGRRKGLSCGRHLHRDARRNRETRRHLGNTRTLTAKFVSNMGEVEKRCLTARTVQPPAAEDTLHRLFCFELVGWEGGSMEKLSSDMTYTAVYDYVPTDVSYFDFALNEGTGKLYF